MIGCSGRCESSFFCPLLEIMVNVYIDRKHHLAARLLSCFVSIEIIEVTFQLLFVSIRRLSNFIFIDFDKMLTSMLRFSYKPHILMLFFRDFRSTLYIVFGTITRVILSIVHTPRVICYLYKNDIINTEIITFLPAVKTRYMLNRINYQILILLYAIIKQIIFFESMF